jgi:four helix bundle protein
MAAKFAEEMEQRAKSVAVEVIGLSEKLHRGSARRVIADQMIRSATSVGANYRAALRARSKKEFAAKLGIVLEEADETLYWIEIAVATRLLPREHALPVWKVTNELVRILVVSLRTSKAAVPTGKVHTKVGPE